MKMGGAQGEVRIGPQWALGALTFMLPWKGINDDDENCGKYFLKEMRKNPALDGDNKVK